MDTAKKPNVFELTSKRISQFLWLIFVSNSEGETVGTAEAEEVSNKTVIIKDIYINTQYRRKGLSHAINDYLEFVTGKSVLDTTRTRTFWSPKQKINK